MNSFHHWFYRRYWWLLLVLFAFSFISLQLAGALRELAPVTVLLGLFIAAFYFAQKQRLADQKLQVELLMHFNGRLAQLEPKVRSIHNEGEAGGITAEQYECLSAYFELCGQIYFHYTRHQIPESIWRTWLNRIRVYYYNPRIRKVWDMEFKRDILYGFDSEQLK